MSSLNAERGYFRQRFAANIPPLILPFFIHYYVQRICVTLDLERIVVNITNFPAFEFFSNDLSIKFEWRGKC